MDQDLQMLENSVKSTGDQLDLFTSRLIDVEKHLYNSTLEGGGEGSDEVDDACVMELLESMTEVKNEYQNLRKDIQEVQQLQKEMTSSLRYQMRAMTQTFNLLKKRIEVNAQKS